jgi:hypothetical protein
LPPQAGKKGPALFIVFVVASAFVALVVLLDGQVLAPLPDTEKLIEETALQSSLSQPKRQAAMPAEPSDVSRQLGRAIEAANQNETDSVSRLEERITASKTAIDQTNRLLEEKGLSGREVSPSQKLQQINQQIHELQSRLAELNASQ